MEIYEKINQLIKEKHLTKRDFAQRLIALEPKLKSTGEIPSEKTIYKYLNGSIAIRIELIPFIAEALQVTEQELFLTSKKQRLDFFRKMVQTANDEELEIIKKRLLTKYKASEILKNYETDDSQRIKNTIKDDVIYLLEYAPEPLLESLFFKLKDLQTYISDLDKI
jgi:transcriptional regulator with XRE-family HTH domain